MKQFEQILLSCWFIFDKIAELNTIFKPCLGHLRIFLIIKIMIIFNPIDFNVHSYLMK